ncbi:MAG: hypothetical protein H7039_03160, partial [Bryobacteraceae bacterium]|nr:hypothetical protein [Bryobacteraceae bacterium]
VNPVYLRGLPGTFVQRLGRLPSEFFFSGTYPAGGYRIGLIRIPSYAPADQISAVNQFLREVTYMQENTDGLIIDQARNPGGSVAYTQTLLSLLHHYPFRTLGFSVRATSAWIFAYSSARESAIAQGAPSEIIAQFDLILNAMREANRANRGMTTPVPLAGLSLEIQPVRDVRGNLLSFSKPLMVLIDEFSASGGDAFAAVIQDSGRGPLFGYRTMGAGGNVAGYDAGSFSQGFVSVTESLMVRASERAESGPYPVSPYVENVGVRPDIEYDIMTRQNLLQNFRPYVSAFSEAMVNWIQSVNRGAAQ